MRQTLLCALCLSLTGCGGGTDPGAAASGGGSSENEIYSPSTGWSVASPQFGWPLYPHLHLLVDGRVFHSGMRSRI